MDQPLKTGEYRCWKNSLTCATYFFTNLTWTTLKLIPTTNFLTYGTTSEASEVCVTFYKQEQQQKQNYHKPGGFVSRQSSRLAFGKQVYSIAISAGLATDFTKVSCGHTPALPANPGTVLAHIPWIPILKSFPIHKYGCLHRIQHWSLNIIIKGTQPAPCFC
jgi:hypothetical protein